MPSKSIGKRCGPKAGHGVTAKLVAAMLEETNGNVREAARRLGLARGTIHGHLNGRLKGSRKKPIASGKLKATTATKIRKPTEGVRRFICTSAQNNTKINETVWNNLLALADHYKAEILVSSYSYNQNAYGKLSVKRGTLKAQDSELWYDERLLPYLERWDNRDVEIAPGLIWCGRTNTIPTAKKPLSGFESYTGPNSGIFPHAKIAMQSIATGKHEPTKLNYTTGTVTKINYIVKKAGLLAEFHHAYGALLVEVDSDGDWFVRQMHAGADGVICDLDLRVEKGVVTTDNRIEAITYGDIHAPNVDPTMEKITWGAGGMVDVLQPKTQILHDVIDFRARNHHDRKNPHKRLELYLAGKDRVVDELKGVVGFLNGAVRPFCKTVIVASNHDEALMRWLREADWHEDPPNAEFYLEAQSAVVAAMKAGNYAIFLASEWALKKLNCPEDLRFLRRDESFTICRGTIECGQHGDLGPNGSRGGASLSRLCNRMNVGDSHTAGIIDGLYTAGHNALAEQGYNRGPSSWSHSDIIVYATGKRAIITKKSGKWRAQ